VKASKTLAIAFTAIVGFLGTNKAQAAPKFLLPDTNFVSHGNGITLSTLSSGKLSGFQLSIDTTKGDSMAIDFGTGFGSATGTLSATDEGGVGALSFTSGENTVSATLLSAAVGNSLVGKDLFALYRVTSSTMSGVHVGALLGVDGLIFNTTVVSGQTITGQIKGDMAPVVPEPASLSLLLLGLGGMTAAARRRLS
jgi:hypothetical protein